MPYCPVHPDTVLCTAVFQGGTTVTWCDRCHWEAWQPVPPRYPTYTKESLYVEAC